MNNEDMSDVLKKLNSFIGQNNNNISPDMVNNLFNMVNNSNTENTSNTSTSSFNDNQSTSSNFNNIDFETIMRMKTIIDKMNVKDDPRSNLLQSLKPFLKIVENQKLTNTYSL